MSQTRKINNLGKHSKDSSFVLLTKRFARASVSTIHR